LQQAAEAELKRFKTLLPAANYRVAEAERVTDEARQAVDRTEIAVLAGRQTDADLAVAQGHLADCLSERAIALAGQSHILRMLTLVPYAIAQHRARARVLVVAHVQAEYQAALADLRETLVAAKAANDHAMQMFQYARRELEVGFDAHYHASVLDAGDAGLITTAAGLDQYVIYEPLLDGERFALYLADLGRHLTDNPALPQRDLDRRVRLEAAIEYGIAHDREIERRMEATRRQNDLLARLDRPEATHKVSQRVLFRGDRVGSRIRLVPTHPVRSSYLVRRSVTSIRETVGKAPGWPVLSSIGQGVDLYPGPPLGDV
jgi:hypothetical protein